MCSCRRCLIVGAAVGCWVLRILVRIDSHFIYCPLGALGVSGSVADGYATGPSGPSWGRAQR
eukprot:3326448-Pyramimonas_sp.AAC.1